MELIANLVSKLKRKRPVLLLALCVAAAIALPAQTLTTIHSFAGGNGNSQAAGLMQATNGDFYGTIAGATATAYGSVFKLTPSGVVTTEYNFCETGPCSTTGEFPTSGLVQAINGNLYGTTNFGGAWGYGSIFKMTPAGTLGTLYSVCPSPCANVYEGGSVNSGLIQATDGNLYGTTSAGGEGYGTIFKMTPGGTVTILHSFIGGPEDGAAPRAPLVQGTDGNLYGTTYEGGSHESGVIYKISLTGKLTLLYNSCAQTGCADGALPAGALIQATDGDFYGTTYAGGGGSDSGTAFKITARGVLTTIHTFCAEAYCDDGDHPWAGLVQGTDGNFYGTTATGGFEGDGAIFKITPSGVLTTLYSFCSQKGKVCEDGYGPVAPLVQATSGEFYGTTEHGGTHTFGTAFRLSVGLGPFVKTQTSAGKVGAAIKILGTDLTGATSVSFNGVAAEFTVNSASAITATVPEGAVSGTVQVITPSGVLDSNVPFTVK